MGEAKRRSHDDVSVKTRPASARLAWLAAGLAVFALVIGLAWLTGVFSGTEDVEKTVQSLRKASSELPGFPAEHDVLGVSIGDPDAPVVIREFGDYQCAACARFATLSERIRDSWVKTGKVRLVFFDLPIASLHPNAMLAAQAARCAGDQRAFWPMHDLLFEAQPRWSPLANPKGHFMDYAASLKLDEKRFEQCLTSERHRQKIGSNLNLARTLGVVSTPTVLVDNMALPNALSWETLQALVEGRL